MMIQPLRLGLAFAACVLAAGAAAADTIYLLDGKSHEDVTVRSETFKEISFKVGSKKDTIKTDDVLRIDYSSKSQLVDRADVAAAEGQILDAISDLETFVDGHLASGRKPRYGWEPAYAMFRLVELYGAMGDVESMIAAVDRLVEKEPESRFVPFAFLAKAEAQFFSGSAANAQKTLKKFLDLIQGKSLSQRWQIEQKLAVILYDTKLKGKSLRTKLEAISTSAGSQYPRVKNAAQVAIAESHLADKDFGKAEPIFRSITDNPKAAARTLAAAYTGLGDCLFKRAVSGSGDKAELIKSAKLAYMRVVVVYKDQVRYAPKAMFWAGRAFDESGEELDKESAQKLYQRVSREYRGTKWADEANAFRKR